jgi:hypothetical protein
MDITGIIEDYDEAFYLALNAYIETLWVEIFPNPE